MSDELIETILVTEDIRYYEHSGIDLRGLIRAGYGVFKNIITLGQTGLEGGGSTITQQLAKNLFKTRKMKGKLTEVPGIGIFIVKLKEWIVAIQLEKFYTKNEILSMYLNTAEFGSNAYGIKVASDTYFKKTPSEINYNEAAILVGLINKPTKYNPIYNPEFAQRKRTEVLYNLYKYNKINRTK